VRPAVRGYIPVVKVRTQVSSTPIRTIQPETAAEVTIPADAVSPWLIRVFDDNR
jgi:hypothetical protein